MIGKPIFLNEPMFMRRNLHASIDHEDHFAPEICGLRLFEFEEHRAGRSRDGDFFDRKASMSCDWCERRIRSRTCFDSFFEAFRERKVNSRRRANRLLDRMPKAEGQAE